MAHLPPQFLSAQSPFSQPKTLFLIAPGKQGILVTRNHRRHSAKQMQFAGSHAALTWCEKFRIGLVYFYPDVLGCLAASSKN